MSANTKHENTSAKRNSGRKSALTEGDRRTLRRIVSKNHRTTAAQVTGLQNELNIRLEDPVSTKTVRRELHKFNIRATNVIAAPLITEINAQMLKRQCNYHKTWTWDKWKRARGMVSWVVLHAVPNIRKGLRLEDTQSGIPGSNRGDSVIMWEAVSWYSILLVPLLLFYCKGVGGQVG
jgi:hypothetical protein